MRIIICLSVVLVSLIYGLPNIVLFNRLGVEYSPLVISKNSPIARDEAYAYAPQVKHILEGNFTIGEILVEEYKNFPTPFFGETFPSQIYAILAILTGSIPKAFIAGDFIFPPVIFLLLYLIAKGFIKNSYLALSAALVATFSRDFIAVIPYPHETFLYLTNSEGRNYFLHLARAFHPQFTLTLFLGSFLSLKNLIRSGSIPYTLALGIITGLLFYSYLFYWTYAAAFISLVFLYLIFKKEFPAVRNLLISSLIALVIAIPYFLNMANFYRLDLAADFVAKASSPHSGIPFTIYRYLIIALLFLVIYKVKTKDRNIKAILFLFLISGFLLPIASNLIIGQDLETMHYVRRALMPLATLAGFAIFYQYLPKNKFLITAISIIVTIGIFAFAVKSQIVTTDTVSKNQSISLETQYLLSWFSSNTKPNDVVGTLDTALNHYLSVYTHNKLYFPPTDRTIMPAQENAVRYTILSNLLGIDSTQQKRNLDNLLSYMFIYQTYTKGIGLDLNSPKRLVAEELIDEASDGNWQKSLNRYRLDYLIVGPVEFAAVKPNMKFLEPQTSIGEYVIFKTLK